MVPSEVDMAISVGRLRCAFQRPVGAAVDLAMTLFGVTRYSCVISFLAVQIDDADGSGSGNLSASLYRSMILEVPAVKGAC